MSSEDQEQKKVLDEVSPERREFVSKSIKAGFVAPLIGSFTLSGLMATPAAAQGNMSP